MNIDKDAFSSGQVLSKLWLAENLERLINEKLITSSLRILILGGWYGVLNLILRSRNNIKIDKVRSLDIDQTACCIADNINNAWVWQDWQFKSICDDANLFQYHQSEFDVVINTSVEHIDSAQWFDNIPSGTIVALQSNNMDHEDHCHNHTSLDHFKENFNLSEIWFSGEKVFEYPDWAFTRFMIIGIK